MKKLLLIALASLALTQTSNAWLFSKQKTSVLDEQRHSYDNNAQDIEHVVTGEKVTPQSTTVSGFSNSVTIIAAKDPSDYRATTKVSSASNSQVNNQSNQDATLVSKLPFSIALILTGVGIFVLFAALAYARSQSKAVDIAVGAGDAALAAVEQKVVDHLTHPATTVEQANILNDIRATIKANQS